MFGIVRPVLLWPHGLGNHLNAAQIEAILAHEVAHVRRRDNLWAAVHGVVQTVFWFHPVVWWLGGRLVDERERACDEDVLGLGSEPQAYAEGILKTCRSYLESPLVCVAGVTGANLKRRIEQIMAPISSAQLDAWRALLLLGAGMVTFVGPIAFGVFNPSIARAQVPGVQAGLLDAVVASVKVNKSGDWRSQIRAEPGGRLTVTNNTLRNLIRNAYGLQDFQIEGGPAWLNDDRFDLIAKAEGDPSRERLEAMLKALLADRFKLAMHYETKPLPIYALVVSRSDGRLGSQMRRAEVDCAAVSAAARARGNAPPPAAFGVRPACGIRSAPGNIIAGGIALPQLASALSVWAERIVTDRTELSGNFDVDLQWTPDPTTSRPVGIPADALPPVPANGPSLFTAVQEQLGLKLESTKGPVEVLVIDRAEHPADD